MGRHEKGKYRAEFLWPHAEGSVEEAGYEFVNGKTEPYREMWWKVLLARAQDTENRRLARRVKELERTTVHVVKNSYKHNYPVLGGTRGCWKCKMTVAAARIKRGKR